MSWRIKLVSRDLEGVIIYEGGYLQREGVLLEYPTEEECVSAIASLEAAGSPFKGTMEPREE
jgi:hypothetical protein